MKQQLNPAEAFVYYGYVICTLGIAWVIKIIIKKAIIEAKNDE